MRTLVAAVLLLCISLCGTTVSANEFNGVNWSRLGTSCTGDKVLYSVKLSYVMGFLRGHDQSMLYAVKRENGLSLSPGDITVIKPGEIVKFVDRFYADSQNINIPLSHAFVIACAKLSGVEESSIKSAVQGLQVRYKG